MQALDSSFRDPAGYIFEVDGRIRRRVNAPYAATYDLLLSSGLYDELAEARCLIPHREVEDDSAPEPGSYRVLEPARVPFISYPYEWSFTQLQDAALLTLDVQRRALARGMMLKDASAYNVQFLGGAPVLIDTLSFDRYIDGSPWPAYRQFCQHFLAPIALMSQVDIRLAGLLRVHLDGIPIDLAARLLPRRTRLRPGLLLHIHLHARSLARHARTSLNRLARPPRMSLSALNGLVDNLTSTIRSFRWNPEGTEWADYTSGHNYSDEGGESKAALVREYLSSVDSAGKVVWDLGANTGLYSRIAAGSGASVVSFDVDPAAADLNYLRVRKDGDARILPLLMDITNPSPSIGWANRERPSWRERGTPDIVLALALVHHLAIGNNLPLDLISRTLSEFAPVLVIEFVPKTDSQVERLLGSRPDIFPDYHVDGFEHAFGRHYSVLRSEPIPDSERRIYLLERRCT